MRLALRLTHLSHINCSAVSAAVWPNITLHIRCGVDVSQLECDAKWTHFFLASVKKILLCRTAGYCHCATSGSPGRTLAGTFFETDYAGPLAAFAWAAMEPAVTGSLPAPGIFGLSGVPAGWSPQAARRESINRPAARSVRARARGKHRATTFRQGSAFRAQ